MRVLRLLLLPFLLPCCSGLTAQAPNIVVVFIDDMGWGDFSCFGNEAAETDHVDALASEGLCFTQFYVNSPICSPSRTALTTGQYPQRWRISSYLASRDANEKRGMAQWLDPKAPVLARMLQAAGYATGHFGKWHMGGQRDVGDAPLITEYGFDASLTNFEGLGPRVLPLKYAPKWQEPKKHGLGSGNLGRGPIVWKDRATITADFVAGALEFMREAVDAKKPFYVNLWPDDVHTPMHPPLEEWGDGKPRTKYLAVLEAMDEQLAPLFDFVKGDESLRDNTIILICSDNGPQPGFGSPGPFRGSKATLYEAGVRSPLVVWAPGLMAESARGATNTESVFSAMDLVPSLLKIAGVELAEDPGFDGEDVSATLLGNSKAGRDAPIYFRRPPDRENFAHYRGLPDLAVRMGDYKFYLDYDLSGAQLYDVVEDPGETKDLASEHSNWVMQLTGDLMAWHESMPADAGDR